MKNSSNTYLHWYVKIKTWKIRTIDRLRAANGVDWILVLLTALLGWACCSYVLQVLIALLMMAVIPPQSLNASWFTPITMLVASITAILAYFPLLALPRMKEYLFGNGSWLTQPHDDEINHHATNESPLSLPDNNDAVQGNEMNDKTGHHTSFKWIITSILGAIISLILIQGTSYLIQMTYGPNVSNNSSVSIDTLVKQLAQGNAPLPWAIILTILVTVFIAPFFEECLFRGVALRATLNSPFAKNLNGEQTRMRTIMSIVLSSLLFATIHIQGAGTSTPNLLFTIIGITIMGIVLGFIAEKYKSILPSYVAHVLINGIQMILVIL